MAVLYPTAGYPLRVYLLTKPEFGFGSRRTMVLSDHWEEYRIQPVFAVCQSAYTYPFLAKFVLWKYVFQVGAARAR